MQKIGRYEIGERIGQGAMADVFRAHDPQIDRVLAIKVLRAEYRRDSQYAARFLREARAAGALSHPNIVTIYDVGEADEFPYIAMELLQGGTLEHSLAARKPLPPDVVADIGVQLGEALSYAHASGVVHRDVKPSNIMLAPDGRSVKILDFGIARIDEPTTRRADAHGLQTQLGQVIGTPRYMSPEQAFGKPADGRSDLFSVGVVLYELACGRDAFEADCPTSLALQVALSDPPPIRSFQPAFPRGLAFIIQKLMAKQPERRFASGEKLVAALRREQGFLGGREARRMGRAKLPMQIRLALGLGALTAAMLALSTGVIYAAQTGAMRQMAITSGEAIASFVASNAAVRAVDNATLPDAERDWLPVQAFVSAAAKDPNVRRIEVADNDGVVRAASQPYAIGSRFQAQSSSAPLRTGGVAVANLPLVAGTPGLSFTRPILYAGRQFGLVRVELNEGDLAAAGRLCRELLASLVLATVAVVILATFGAARLVALPIRRLTTALDDAARGNLDFRLSHRRHDELGELFEAFNRLVGSVQGRLGDLGEEHRPTRAAGMHGAFAAADPTPPAPFAPPDPDPLSTRVAPLARSRASAPANTFAAHEPATAAPEPAAQESGVAALWRSRWTRAAHGQAKRPAA